MTPALLNRASQGFRRGYRDGHAGQATNPYHLGTFAAYDWSEGRDAALAEQAVYARLKAARDEQATVAAYVAEGLGEV